jgi:hypothetical protein
VFGFRFLAVIAEQVAQAKSCFSLLLLLFAAMPAW